MYTLHIANKNYSSWSLRPWVLMRELNIPFTEQLIPFDHHSSWEKFRSFSPTGLVPCLHANEHIVWESLAIVEYLADHHERVWPHNESARIWARSATAEMHAGFNAIRGECPMSVGIRVNRHQTSDALTTDLQRLAELWQQGLELFKGPFLAGDEFTAVDAFFAPVCYRIQTYNLQLPEPCAVYVQHILARPAMREWTAAALQEPYREPDHEEEIQALGTWLEDQRI